MCMCNSYSIIISNIEYRRFSTQFENELSELTDKNIYLVTGFPSLPSNITKLRRRQWSNQPLAHGAATFITT